MAKNLADAASLMHTLSPAFDLDSSSKASSVTTGHVSFASRGGKKTVCDSCGRLQLGWYDRRIGESAICHGDMRMYLEFEVRRVDCRRCWR